MTSPVKRQKRPPLDVLAPEIEADYLKRLRGTLRFYFPKHKDVAATEAFADVAAAISVLQHYHQKVMRAESVSSIRTDLERAKVALTAAHEATAKMMRNKQAVALIEELLSPEIRQLYPSQRLRLRAKVRLRTGLRQALNIVEAAHCVALKLPQGQRAGKLQKELLQSFVNELHGVWDRHAARDGRNRLRQRFEASAHDDGPVLFVSDMLQIAGFPAVPQDSIKRAIRASEPTLELQTDQINPEPVCKAPVS